MTPEFRILADGADVTAAIRDNLVSIRLSDRDGMEADQVEIAVADPRARIALPRRGVSLSVALGWRERALVDKGTFTVDEVGEDGPPDVITILARAADFRASLKDARDASYDGTTIGAILATVAERHGLIPAVHPGLAATTVQHLDQTNESDANMVTRLGEDYGAVATIKSGRLVFVPRGRGLGVGGILPTFTIDRADGDRHGFRAIDRDGSQTGIQAKWHDTRTGATLFALAGKEGSVKVLKKTYPDQDAAQAAADAAWTRAKGKSHEFSVTLAVGRPDIIACAPLRLTGWRREITALDWVAGAITHTLDASGGLTTDISATEVVKDE